MKDHAFTVTCDRLDGLIRAAVWEGKARKPRDVFVDKIATPDLSGAIAQGRVTRVTAGGKTAWIDAGLPKKIYIQTRHPLQNGQSVRVRIRTTAGQEGKAWAGELLPFAPAQEGTFAIGMISPPKAAWQRALDSLPEPPLALRFGAAEDYAAFRACGLLPQIKAELNTKEPVHPDLEETLESLLSPHVPLSGGASLIIEPTEALVAIDVNGGLSNNPLAVNLIAVAEIARQLRLRNLGGIVAVDCLKMPSRTDGAKVSAAFTRASADDPAGVYVYGLSRLGLLEATRARYGLPLSAYYNERKTTLP